MKNQIIKEKKIENSNRLKKIRKKQQRTFEKFLTFVVFDTSLSYHTWLRTEFIISSAP